MSSILLLEILPLWIWGRIYCSNSMCTPIQENFECKKQGPFPISLVRAARIFSEVKALETLAGTKP